VPRAGALNAHTRRLSVRLGSSEAAAETLAPAQRAARHGLPDAHSGYTGAPRARGAEARGAEAGAWGSRAGVPPDPGPSEPCTAELSAAFVGQGVPLPGARNFTLPAQRSAQTDGNQHPFALWLALGARPLPALGPWPLLPGAGTLAPSCAGTVPPVPPLAATKKMQLEIEKALKKVQEGIEEFQVTWDKMQEATEVQHCTVLLLALASQGSAWRAHVLAAGACFGDFEWQPDSPNPGTVPCFSPPSLRAVLWAKAVLATSMPASCTVVGSGPASSMCLLVPFPVSWAHSFLWALQGSKKDKFEGELKKELKRLQRCEMKPRVQHPSCTHPLSVLFLLLLTQPVPSSFLPGA